MRLPIIFIVASTFLLLAGETTYAQKQALRLVGESRYYLYRDNTGKEYTVPVDSIHYGYAKSRGNELCYIFNNTVDTDKYPETAYLPEPGFYDIYPAAYDTAIKLDNKEDSLLFIENWSTTYLELNEYDKGGNPLRQVNLLTNAQTINKYAHNKLLETRNIYLPDSTGDSVALTGYIQYMYDKKERLSLKKFVPAKSPDSAVGILYYYDAKERVSRIESPNRIVSFSYDSSKQTKTITAQIAETIGKDSSAMVVRNTYVYDKGDLTFYKQEKREDTGWTTLTSDTLTYDDKHQLLTFRDGGQGLYHDFALRWNSYRQPVFRTSEITDEKLTRFLPDGSKVKLFAAECHYYYEFYNLPKH